MQMKTTCYRFTCELVEMQIPKLQPHLMNQKLWGWGSGMCVINKFPK